jgi:Protein kinase domain
MEQSQETTRGIEYLRDIIQSGKILKLTNPRPVNQGYSYLFPIKAFEKEWYFSLSRNQINDLPGTQSYHQPALALAKALELRFQNVDPNFYVTVSGRLIKIDLEWPPLPWMSQNGMVPASGIWAYITDLITQEVTKCPVQTTELQMLAGGGMVPFARPEYVTNTIRSFVDSGDIRFYPNRESLPRAFSDIKMQVGGYAIEPRSIQDYLAKKVWLLGFKAGSGRKETKAWIADPWDAAYLGCTEADLRQAAAVLDAQEKIVLHEDSDFAHVGKVLLASDGRIEPSAKPTTTAFRTPFDTYKPAGVIGEGGSGKVLRVIDADGSEYALKYLKPNSTSSQKTKRFRNELAFCMKNTHQNIITIRDWGLADVNGAEVPFYVMPAFPQTLRSLMNDEKGPKRLIPVFMQMLDGVEAAHKVGIWHRDLKPENILFDESEDRAVITDFGIAHFSEEWLRTTVETGPQDRLANFRYAAPEQRSTGTVDQRADIYALGLILYEMLTGLFLQGTSHKQIQSVHPNLASLDSMIDRMSCQEPSDRPASIGEIRELLLESLRGLRL